MTRVVALGFAKGNGPSTLDGPFLLMVCLFLPAIENLGMKDAIFSLLHNRQRIIPWFATLMVLRQLYV